jgi:hypothetical protein
VHVGTTKVFHHTRRSAHVLKAGAEDRVRGLAIRIEPETVQLASEAFADQLEARGKRLGTRAVAHENDLRTLRAALDHHLQVTCEAQMCAIRVRRDLRIDQRAPHDAGNPIDEGMLNGAVGDVHHVMRIELEQPDLRCAQPSANSQSRTMSKAGGAPGNDVNVWQTMTARQFGECGMRGRRDSSLAKPWASGARRPVGARRNCAGLWDAYAHRRAAYSHVPEDTSNARINS